MQIKDAIQRVRGVVLQALAVWEPHISSSSSIQYMESVWPQLAAMHLKTVLAPVAWETIEPEENHFD